MAYPSYTYTITNGSLASGSYVQQDFTDILNGISDGTKDIYVSTIRTAGNVAVGSATANIGSVGGRWLTIMGTASNGPGFIELATPTATTDSGGDAGGVNWFNGTVHAGELNVTNSSGGTSADYYMRFRTTTGTTALFEMLRCGGPGGSVSSYVQAGLAAKSLKGTVNYGFNFAGTGTTADATGETLGASFPSTATVLMASFRSRPNTEAASYTTTSLRHFYQDTAIVGTGHTITREVAYWVDGKGSGGTIGQFAALSDNLSFSGDHFISQSGTNPSVLAGKLTVNAQLIGKGTAKNDSASTGYIGEYVEAKVTTPTNFPTSGQYGDVASISLTAGDWDVTVLASANLNGATAFSFYNIGISATSGNASTGLVEGENMVPITNPSASGNRGGSVPCYRVSIASTTTYYFKIGGSTFATATPQYVGRISARRMR